MKLSELPGIPAPPMEKRAAEGKTYEPFSLEQPDGPAGWSAAAGGAAGAAYGGRTVQNLLNALGQHLPASAGIRPSQGVPDISKVLDMMKRKAPASGAGNLRSAIKAHLQTFRAAPAGGFRKFLGAGPKAPTAELILEHLRKSPTLSAPGAEGAITTAAQSAAQQFKPRGARQAFKGLGGKWKNPLKSRGILDFAKRLKKPGLYGLLALIPTLLGYAGYKTLN